MLTKEVREIIIVRNFLRNISYKSEPNFAKKNKVMKKITVILVLIVVTTILKAQNFQQTIRGKVLDKETHQPLPGASVILLNSNPIIGVISDADGEYVIKNVPIGRQGITVTFIGYNNSEAKNIMVQTGKESVINIELVEKVENLNEVTVSAVKQKDKALNDMALISSRSFAIEQTERFAGSIGDPARMVGNYAGVAMQNDTRNDIVIRGNSPIGIIWKLDDIEIPNPNHFGSLGTTGGPVSMINNNLLSNSDFYTGAFPSEFSNGISGAFDLRMRSGNNSKTEFIGQVGFNGFELGAEGPFSKNSKASYLISGRYSTLAFMHFIGFGTGTGTAVPYYQDITLKIDLPTKKFGKFSLFGLYGASHIDIGGDKNDTSSNSYNMHGMHTKFSSGLNVIGLTNLYFFNSKTRLKTVLSAQTSGNIISVDLFKVNPEYTQQYFRSNNSQKKISVALHLKSKFNSKNNIGVGCYLDYNIANLLDSIYLQENNRFSTLRNVDGNFLTYRAYTQFQHKFTDDLTAYAGINLFSVSLNNEISIEPRAGIEWKFTPLQTISFGFGMHSQMQPNQIYFLQYNDTINNKYIQTNKKIGLSKADHFVLGYSFLLSTNLKFKFETYYQNLYNIPISHLEKEFSMINAGADFIIPIVDSLQNKGVGKNYGVEFTIEKYLDKGYYFLFTSSIFDSKYKGEDNIWRNTAFNSNYIFNLLAGYEFKIGKKSFMTFDAKTVYSGGKRYIPIDISASNAAEELKYDYTQSYKNKYEDYFRLDLRIGFKINGKKISQEFAIDLQNVTVNKSTFTQGYDANTKEIYSTFQQGFYPMFLYRVQF